MSSAERAGPSRAEPTGPSRWPAALRSAPFVRLWAGSIVSSVGTQMSNVAKVWVLYALTRSAVALGLEGLCFSVPIMVLPLIAGPVCDRVDRRVIVQISTAAEAAAAVALAALSAAGALVPWVIYLTAAAEAGRLAFDIPARTALTTVLVPSDALLSAQSLSAVVWSSAALAGPALGGLLLATTGAAVVFAINGVSSVAAFLAFRPIGRVRLGGAARREPSGLASGLRFAARHRAVLRLQVVLLAASALSIGTETLLPILDRTVWHAGSAGYGLLRMAPGLAAVLAGGLLARSRPARVPGRVIAISMAGAGAGLAAFAWAPGLLAALVLLGLASLALTTAQVHLVTGIQQATPDRVRGAVSGLSAIAQSGAAGVAAAGMAVAAASLGARVVIVAAVAAAAGTTAASLGAGACAGHRTNGAGKRQ